jgi:hypothetical protein
VKAAFKASTVLLLCAGVCPGQQEVFQPQRMIDCHTAAILPRGCFSVECRAYPNGIGDIPGSGVTVSIAAGMTHRLTVGFGYGGDGIIGRADPCFNPHIGALIEYAILEESYFFPALAVGYDHQGFGGIDRLYNGYTYKSAGLFCSASKNYLLYSSLQLGLHGGINYSFEGYQDIHWPNGYAGLTVGFTNALSFAMEYDLALNQRDPTTGSPAYYNPVAGFLNMGVRLSITRTFSVEIDAKDVVENKIDAAGNRMGWGREMKLLYYGQLF